MHRTLAAEQNPDLAAAMIWIHMLPADSLEASLAAAQHFSLAGLAHFHDPLRLAGRSVGMALESAGATAWDVYLVFRSGPEWVAEAPEPTAWAHQLTDAWADVRARRQGPALRQWLVHHVRDLKQDPGRTA